MAVLADDFEQIVWRYHAKRGAIVLAPAVLALGSIVAFAMPRFLAGGDCQPADGSCR